jgi:3-deoxy-7-phosphoheptulonate synthase
MAHSTSNVNILKIEELISPEELQRQLPITPKLAETVIEGRAEIQDILHGHDDRFLMARARSTTRRLRWSTR